MRPKALLCTPLTFAFIAGVTLATSTSGANAEPAKPYEPGLVEFMLTVQSHHAKLWLAGNARNWELAEYQADELKELIEDIATRVPVYKDVPVGKMIEAASLPPLGDVEKAIKARDAKAFATAYDKLTAACNSCHEAANRGFIVVQRPASSAFPNQSFAPKRK
jgi:hypothetical protein